MQIRSPGQLHTTVTNKTGTDKKGSIVPMIANAKGDTVTAALENIAFKQWDLVTEITICMAANIRLIDKKYFPNAIRIAH
jgi:hypothetical protein